jgi:hypothetical protein
MKLLLLNGIIVQSSVNVQESFAAGGQLFGEMMTTVLSSLPVLHPIQSFSRVI